MMRSFLSLHGRLVVSLSFASLMIEIKCKGWTITDGMSRPSEDKSIARLACESKAMIHSEVGCCGDGPWVNEPKIIQAGSFSIRRRRH